MEKKLTGELLVERMTPQEKERAALVEEILPLLADEAAQVDASSLSRETVDHFRRLKLLGLVVPQEFGGLGGGLRDLAATTFALGTVCPSTALCFFFHCSTVSRGLLALDAVKAGKFGDNEVGAVTEFAEKLLRYIGSKQLWFSNFGSESIKSEKSAITVSTSAEAVDGGYLLNGVKSFGCSTGISDKYLVTAKLANCETAEGIVTFIVDQKARGISEREKWDAIGMRGTATHGIVLKNVFVPETESLTIPAAFLKMMEMSRGSFVGNQLAGTAVYLGSAHTVLQAMTARLQEQKFQDTGKSIGESPFHQEIIGNMLVDLESGFLWLRRQLELETSEVPLMAKDEVVRQWRLCKGVVNEAAHRVGLGALKLGGTSVTVNSGLYMRHLRDLTMGLVQAFPAERGRLEAAKMYYSQQQQLLFGTGN